MKILSLFDGMACAHIAFNKLGINIDEYISYEIDPYASKVTKHNFPNVKQNGDVFTANYTEHQDVDFLCGGSPCTFWSVAQSKDKRETVAEGEGWNLFQQYIRALNETKPKYFIYENNKSMSKDVRASIDNVFGFDATLINSSLVSTQNRQRLYWVGKRNENGLYDKVNIKQPQDRNILLKHVLDNAVAFQEKAHVLTASYNGAVIWNTLERHQRTMVAEAVCVAQRGRYNENGETEQHYEARTDGKTNTLTTVQKDNNVVEGVMCYKTTHGYNKGGFKEQDKCDTLRASSFQENFKIVEPLYNYHLEIDDDMTIISGNEYELTTFNNTIEKHKVYEVKDGKILLIIKGERRFFDIKLNDGYYVMRKLTVSECKRLQQVPDWYDMTCISNTQAYKALGNGWSVDVICHIIESCLK